MGQAFARSVETVFTAYAVPAFVVPFVWAWGRLLGRGSARTRDGGTLARLQLAHLTVGGLWLVAWLALQAGVPIERGGAPAAALAWCAYAALNIAFARLLVRFTAGYAALTEGSAKDRLFLGFLSLVLAQPLATACAFAVLYRILSVVYRMSVPGLTAVQEGI